MLALVLLGRDPFAFALVQNHWHRELGPPWTAFARSIAMLKNRPSAATLTVQSSELVSTLALLATIAWSAVRLKPSFSIYAALSMLVPLFSGSLMSMPRFALTIFPVHLMLAAFSNVPNVRQTLLAISSVLMALSAALFVTWRWVA